MWFPGVGPIPLAKKVIADQLLFAPVGLSSFYVGLSLLEGKNAEGVYEEWRGKFPSTWAVSFNEPLSGAYIIQCST